MSLTMVSSKKLINENKIEKKDEKNTSFFGKCSLNDQKDHLKERIYVDKRHLFKIQGLTQNLDQKWHQKLNYLELPPSDSRL